MRCAGSFSEQFPLLFRDYLRTLPDEAAGYARLKRTLAARYPHDGKAYTEAKVPCFWESHPARRRLGPADRVGAGTQRRLTRGVSGREGPWR